MSLSRRELIRRMGGGMGVLGLGSVLPQDAYAAFGPRPRAQSAHSPILPLSHSAAAPLTHFPPRAKRVIQLFMNGGPFQGDFFDPKPAINKYVGQRPSEVQLRTENVTGGLLEVPYAYRAHGKSGLEVSDILPNFAGVIDDVCVLRGLYTDNPNHGPALFMMNSGSISPIRPSMGSWMLYGLGSENENLPGYVVLCPGRPVRFAELWSNSFLPGEYQGTYINHSNLNPQQMIPFLRHSGRDLAVQRRQLDLLQELEQEPGRSSNLDNAFEARIKAMETAFRMQTAATDAFDLSREPQAIRDEYGPGHFAHGCLMARRLAERGVRFTQVYYGNGQPWDTHANHNDLTRKLALDIDRPMAALLRDLKRRGLLEDTLVVWGGEFGRTPTTEGANGRDHNHWGFTMWMAGAGVRAGTAYGATDDFGFRAVDGRIHIHDLHATILHMLGLDHERLTFRHASRDFRLTDVYGRVVHEVLA